VTKAKDSKTKGQGGTKVDLGGAAHPASWDWKGATEEERGRALMDLLSLADKLPAPTRTPLRFPRLLEPAQRQEP
jgi:hypothetical protein